MSNASSFFGGVSSGGAAPIGAIVRGTLAGDSDYLPCDGSTYLKSAYPDLDTTCLETFGANPIVQGGAVGAAEPVGLEVIGSRLFVITKLASTTFHTSDDGGVTFTARTLPVTGNTIAKVMQANGRLFILCGSSSNGVYSTVDGITWANHSASLNAALPWSATAYVSTVGYIGGLYVFMRLNSSAAAFLIATSPDLVTFTQRDISAQVSAGTGNVNAVLLSYPLFYSSKFGMVVGASLATSNYALTTPDGLNFTSVASYTLAGTTLSNVYLGERSYELPDGAIISSDGLYSFNGITRDLASVTRPAVNGTIWVAPLWRALCAHISATESTSRVIFSENLGVTRKILPLPSGSLSTYNRQIISGGRWYLACGNGNFYYRDIDATRFATPVIGSADPAPYHGGYYIKVR